MGRRQVEERLHKNDTTVFRSGGRTGARARGALLKPILPIRSHVRRAGVHLGAKITQGHERFGFAGVLEGHAVLRAVPGAEVFAPRSVRGSG